jgi:prepilin-type N-terminal cleavage/methylation domain-containing protein
MTRLRSRLADEGGFTLAELVVVLVILGVVLGALTQFLVSGNNAAADLTARFQAQQQGRLALDALRRELHCASAVSPTSGYPVSSITITLGAYCPSAPSGGGTVTWCTTGGGIRYALWRYVGSACSGTGVKKADYLTASAGKIFTGYTAATGSRTELSVDLPVDAKSTVTSGLYELKDDIVLRNTARG